MNYSQLLDYAGDFDTLQTRLDKAGINYDITWDEGCSESQLKSIVNLLLGWRQTDPAKCDEYCKNKAKHFVN